jgi:hypothetical protein
MKRVPIWLASLVLSLALAGCAQDGSNARVAQAIEFQWTSPNKRVLLVPPDVELSELNAGGILEPRADWTDAAKGHIDKNIKAHFAKSGADVVSADLSSPREIQLAKLYDAVAGAILTHLYDEPLKLPNKGDALDWTLGPGTVEMRDRYGADYALFVIVRDSYSSGGRQALQVLGALTLAVVPGGVQIGVASLVDLRTGNIVWFNRLINTSGDLRTEAPAQRAMEQLLKDVPL